MAGKHWTYSEIVEQAKSVDALDGYSFALVELGAQESSDNPASTKHDIYGPGAWLWVIHPSGITVREIGGMGDLDPQLVEHVVRVATFPTIEAA